MQDIDGIKRPANKVAPLADTRKKSGIVDFVGRHTRVGIVVAGIVVLGAFAWLYVDARNQIARLSDPALAGALEGEDIVKEIGQRLELPNEKPTLATVNDVTKLQGQDFFKQAKDGDKVLIFPKAGRALLYRPTTHKVIEYSKVNLGDDVKQ
ncbi:MAG TPA: hypothetical protein VLA88_03400 [Candidatus Saccharimonadales bacterium]|nr:hypothetical protein [Candidatus Saccharimonadales bacterium]